jgi:hypothetical protein
MAEEQKTEVEAIQKQIEGNALIIRDVLQTVQHGTDPIDHEMAVRVIGLYIENEMLYQRYIDLLYHEMDSVKHVSNGMVKEYRSMLTRVTKILNNILNK